MNKRKNQSTQLAPDVTIAGSSLPTNNLQSLKQRDPNNNNAEKPKAYLNYVFFDKQLNFVGDGSGVKQVDGEAGKLETLASGKVVAKKNGYVYVYTSNESQQNVLFDNLGVEQITGPVLEETHYYPFGLTMSAISAQSFGSLENNYLYQGKELQKDLGLGLYDFQARGYDPAIGRTWQIDPHADKYYNLSPYSWTADNPIHNIDPDGKDWYRFKNKIQWYDNSDKRYVDADGNKWRNVGTEFLQFNGKKLTYSWQTTNDDGKRQVHSVSFNAVSGKGDDPTGYWNTTRIFKYSKNRQKQSNVGPIPEGIYSINKRAFVPSKNESGFQNFEDLGLARKLAAPIGFSNWPGGKYSWGPYRWKLQNEGAKTYGRGNFYLHGGGRWGSRGCIDCGSGITDFRDVFMNNQLSNGKIYLQVKYPANFQIEIQNTPTTNFNVIK